MRFVQVKSHRTLRIVPLEETLPLTAYDEYYVQVVPAEEAQREEGGQVVTVGHFNRDPYTAFGLPFFFVLKKVREREKKYFGVGK